MDIVARAGTVFAFLSQTVHFKRGEGPDTALSQQAEEEVRRWREQRRLLQHRFTDETIPQLTGTLKYPDSGTADGRSKT